MPVTAVTVLLNDGLSCRERTPGVMSAVQRAELYGDTSGFVTSILRKDIIESGG